MFHVVLISPQIPQNTGAIGRLCVNAGAKLHLIKPFAFEVDEKKVRRAGLDYWQKLDPQIYENFEHFTQHNNIDSKRCFFATTKTKQPYFKIKFQKGDYLIFGSESFGIDEKLLFVHKSQNITIPMTKEGRSLNLAISVGIVLYEALRQNFGDFKMMD